MQDKDIRRLFQKAEIQVCPEQKRILKMYEYLQNEIDKNENKKQRKRTEISLRDILWQQFRLIDKTYVIVYIMAVFAGFALMVFLQYAGTGKNDAIMVSMIISGCLSTLSVLGINKLYFGKMAELGATCYFDTRMCAVAGLMVIGSVNFTVIMLLALYSGNTWEVSNLQTVIYILTAYLVSGSLDFGILLFKTGEKASVAMAAGILICSGVYIVVSNISGALFSASISIWAGVCAVAGGLTFVQVKRLFSAGEMVFEEA